MTLQEIYLGITKILSEKTDIHNIVIEDVSNSYTSEMEDSNQRENEILHIQLIPLISKTAAAGYFVEKEILVDIAYMEKLHTSNERIYEVLETLDRAFKPFFKIGDRAFTCNAQQDITDDIGHYKMTLSFTDSVPFTEEEMTLGLRTDWRKENGITTNID